MKLREKFMHKYALSEQGAAGYDESLCTAVTVSDLVLMMPVSLLYFLVKGLYGRKPGGQSGILICGGDGGRRWC